MKKAYSILSQAYTMAVTENGSPNNWGLTGDATGGVTALSKLSPFLKLSKNCGLSSGCFPTGNLLTITGTSAGVYDSATSAKAILNDGTLLSLYIHEPSCLRNRGSSMALQNICFSVSVDVNGFKGPNQLGKDYFDFYVTKYGVIPRASQLETVSTFQGNCLAGDGMGCAAWVLFNGNMDYLNCSDLAWGGKTECN